MENKIEKFRLMVVQHIADELIEDFALTSVTDVSLHATFFSDTIAFRIKQEVYGETLGTLEVQHPATWWQMLKEKHAPFWFRRRWPVRYDTETYKAQVLYPKMSFPGEVHNHVWT